MCFKYDFLYLDDLIEDKEINIEFKFKYIYIFLNIIIYC